MKIRLKLKAKTLWIPLSVIVTTFIIMGVVFLQLTLSESKESEKTDLSTLISDARKQLVTSLSLVTATQGPGDAMLALEGEDDEMARDIIKQVSTIGLDGVFFTALSGKAIYPKGTELSESLKADISNSSRIRNNVTISYSDNMIFGYAPIIDVETPTGFLVFKAKVPEKLNDIAISVLTAKLNGKRSVETKQHADSIYDTLNYFYDASKEKTRQFIRRTFIVNSSILLPVIILITFMLGRTSRNITKQIYMLLDAFKKQAEGDLAQEVQVKSEDEIAQLTQTFNHTNIKLNNMLNDVTTHSDNVAASASQLSAASKNIADNAQNQSAQTDSAVTAMEELSSSFAEVAANTSSVADSAREASELATNGGEIVVNTIEGMNRISHSVNESADIIESLGNRSEQIGEIVKVINDIADQTNLLALNAAIEAARAGDQGRGFAVVADEVRKLAERTTASTGEIGNMIRDIQEDTKKAVESMKIGKKEVEDGVDMANKAGDSLKYIVTSVQNVTQMVQQISTAVEEQSRTGEEITGNIETVANLTKETYTASLNSSESSQSLDELAHELQQLVSGFKLRSGTSDNALGKRLNHLSITEDVSQSI